MRQKYSVHSFFSLEASLAFFGTFFAGLREGLALFEFRQEASGEGDEEEK